MHEVTNTSYGWTTHYHNTIDLKCPAHDHMHLLELLVLALMLRRKPATTQKYCSPQMSHLVTKKSLMNIGKLPHSLDLALLADCFCCPRTWVTLISVLVQNLPRAINTCTVISRTLQKPLQYPPFFSPSSPSKCVVRSISSLF